MHRATSSESRQVVYTYTVDSDADYMNLKLSRLFIVKMF